MPKSSTSEKSRRESPLTAGYWLTGLNSIPENLSSFDLVLTVYYFEDSR